MSLFLRNDRLRNYFIKTAFWKLTNGVRDRYWGNGTLSKLMRIDLKPTEQCNLHCPICGQWGDKGSHKTEAHKPHNELPLSTWEKLIDEMRDIRPLFYLWGGEPLLYRSIIPLIQKIKSIQAPCFLVTNGMHLEELAEEIVNASPDMLIISLDGPAEKHDAIRGHEGLYDTIMEGIKKLNKRKKELGTQYPLIMTTTTLSPASSGAIVPLFKELEKHDITIDSALLALPWMLTEDECEAYEADLLTRFSCETPSFARGFVNQLESDTIASLQKEVEELQALTLSFPYALFPDIPPNDWNSFLHQKGKGMGKNGCNAIYTTVQIASNGDVSSCRDFPDIVHGNICREPLLDIVNNESFCNFRCEIKKEYLPLCHKCCNFYEHSGLYFPALKL